MLRTLGRADVQRLVTMKDAIAAVRDAFAAAGRGQPLMPRPFELHLPDAGGELHHAVEAGVFEAGSVYGELGALAAGLAEEHGGGRDVPLGG